MQNLNVSQTKQCYKMAAYNLVSWADRCRQNRYIRIGDKSTAQADMYKVVYVCIHVYVYTIYSELSYVYNQHIRM